MKALRTFVTFMSAFAIASAFGSGIAYGDEADTTKPTAEIDGHVYAIGDSIHVEKRSVKVSYADLNLNNEKGVAVLYRRLHRHRQIKTLHLWHVGLSWFKQPLAHKWYRF